jgi:lysine 2,3-aminomutase
LPESPVLAQQEQGSILVEKIEQREIEMEDERESQELEEPPGSSITPPHPWEAIPLEAWSDWRWQLAHRLSTVDELLGAGIHLTPDEIEGLSAPGRFRVDVTPYFASLIDPDDPACPIRRQVIPTAQELAPFSDEMADSLAEDSHSPVPGLVHRYPDRALMLVTTQCASYCRYCTRSRLVGNPAAQFSRGTYDAQIDYIARTPQIRDVLISGGDPLTLPVRVLEDILQRLRAIEHIEVIRIGSRVPIFLPMRITSELTDMLRKYHPQIGRAHV